MKDAIRTSVVMLASLTLLTGVVYPVVVTVVAQFVFPSQSNGSLIKRDGKTVGSSLIGQSFAKPEYFWGRPSATSPFPYNAASSSGSNLGPLNPALKENVKSRLGELRRFDSKLKMVPVDLVTSSASGLDPHISPAAAEAQVSRVAAARHKSEDEVRRLVAMHTEGRQLGLFGEPRVNVLRLNLDMDRPGTLRDEHAGWRISIPTHHAQPTQAPDEPRTQMRLSDVISPHAPKGNEDTPRKRG